MAIATIQFLDRNGFKNAEDIIVKGNCLQHTKDNLANEAMISLVTNRQTLEAQPWLIDIIPTSGLAQDRDGNVAIATWEKPYEFVLEEETLEEIEERESWGTLWGTPPNKEGK